MVPISALLRFAAVRIDSSMKCGCAFSVGAGNPGDRQPLGGMLVKVARLAARVRGVRGALAPTQLLRAASLLAESVTIATAPARDGFVDELVAIAGFASHGNENICRALRAASRIQVR